MNPRTKKKMDSINDRLAEYNQSVRIIELSATTLQLSTGVVLTDNDAARFIKRVMNTKIDAWVKNTDKLLSGEVADTVIKSLSFSIGGKAVQKMHGEKIKKQLNIGTPWNKDLKGKYPYHYSCKESTKEKISEKNSGSRNGMYGKTMSAEERDVKSKKMRQLILAGEFTPNSNNRNTHWDSSLDGFKFRSSWEALYKFINPNAEYESLRIEYYFDSVTRIYIVDFVDHVNKMVIEVKPKELCSGPVYNAKMTALSAWASSHQYKVLIATKEYFKSYPGDIDYSRFDGTTKSKIKKLYETS